jgi:thioester reductase-like protein
MVIQRLMQIREQILIKAAENGLKTCSLRVGQISGNRTNGAWALNEWIPMTIKTSVALGCLPEEEGVRFSLLCPAHRISLRLTLCA